MYIGIGTIVLIVIIALVILMLRRLSRRGPFICLMNEGGGKGTEAT
jgi:hypothetical protein